jgi:hypothetical protein
MDQLFRFSDSVTRSPDIDTWMRWQKGQVGKIAKHWFEVIRKSGTDVREILHDGHPTACVGDAAFAYVDTFKAHVNVGFFRGAEIADPQGMREGSGKFMRHVKIRPGSAFDERALSNLISAAYVDMKDRARSEKDTKQESSVERSLTGPLMNKPLDKGASDSDRRTLKAQKMADGSWFRCDAKVRFSR